jgi:acyl-CoA thioester hydrolase
VTPVLLIRHRLDVRFSDCDALGHVNNARYLSYLEEARLALWRHQLKLFEGPIAANAPRGQGFILARAEVDFRAQARHGEWLEVRLTLHGFGRSSLTYEYDIVRLADDVVIAQAKTVQVWFDYDANRSVAMDDAVKEKLSQPVSI